MSVSLQKTSNDYVISVDRLAGKTTAFRQGKPVAASSEAKVMYETRLPPVVYFPITDVEGELIEVPDHRTFCPFKGTATYFDLKLGDETVARAAWAYNNPLPEAKMAAGHVAFMPNVISKLDLGGNELAPASDGNITGPIVDWIIREAWLCKTPEELTAAFARKLLEDGVAISHLSIFIWSLHPLIAGKSYIWSKATDTVKSHAQSYDILQQPEYVESPLRHVSNGLGGVRQRLDVDETEFNFPIMQKLKSKGASDYVAMPLWFSNGQINVMTLASDHPDGFTTANLGLVFECASVLSRYYEVFVLKENSEALLETYLGKRTGKRVLGGEIRRGDGDEIEAAILFCDLRGSTRLESTLGRKRYIQLLNRFFEEITDIINQHEGEVLKFIGDAVLAIFPSDGVQAKACKQALSSATKIVEQICKPYADDEAIAVDCSIGIAFGNVTYGNIGSKERLDFTVIGAAANIAARLGDYGKNFGHKIVTTDDVAKFDPAALSLGKAELHNVANPVDACAIVIPSP